MLRWSIFLIVLYFPANRSHSSELAHRPVNLNQSKIAGGGAIKPLVALVTRTANEIVKVIP